MTQGPDYLIAIQTKNFEFWRIDASGNVVVSTQPYFLEFSPEGWNDIAIQNIRNKFYWGTDRTVSVPQSYLKDGAKIIKYILYTRGLYEKVDLVVLRQKLQYTPGVSYGFWHKLLYRGEIDLNSFLHASEKVTCATLEDGLPKYLKANEKTLYEFPMNVPEAINVLMDGMNLRNKVENFVNDGTGITDPNYNFGNHLVDLVITNEDAPYIGGKKEVRRTKVGNVNADIKNTKGWFAAPVAGIIDIEWDFEIKLEYTPSTPSPNPAAEYFTVVRRINSSGAGDNPAILLNIGATGDANRFNTTRRLTGSASITVNEGDELYLYSFCNIQGASGDDQIRTTYTMNGNSYFKYDYKYRAPSTFVKHFRGQYLAERLIEKLGEGNYLADVSPFLDRYKQVVFTCGNALRGFEDAVMKISWYLFFQFWDCFSAVGISEKDGKVLLDEKQNLIDYVNSIQIPSPMKGSVKIYPAKEYQFNTYEVGYPEIKNEVGILNGNEEFNTKFVFSLPASGTTAKLDKISQISAQCYQIEQVRVTTLNKDTTDYKSDNDVFVNHIEAVQQPGLGALPAYYKLDRSLNATATGLLEVNTVWNLFLSPGHNTKRNAAFIHSHFYKGDFLTLSYTSSDKNNKLVCDGITESADINIGSLSPAFFIPMIIEAEFPAGDDIIEQQTIDPALPFLFEIDGINYKGIQIEGSVVPTTRRTQTFKFLSFATNNLTNFINFNG